VEAYKHWLRLKQIPMNYKSLQEWCAKGTSQISWKSCNILKAKNKNKYFVTNFKNLSNLHFCFYFGMLKFCEMTGMMLQHLG
jgi:hypothetical protein